MSRGIRLTKRQVALLGKDTDAAIADRLGISQGQVQRQRSRRGIPAAGRRRIRLTKRQVALLGKVTDAAIADRLGISITEVHRQRKSRGIPPADRIRLTKRQVALLGKDSDAAIADRLGISISEVHRQRKSRGIPAAFGTSRKYTDGQEAAIRRTVEKLATQYGRSPTAIARKIVDIYLSG